MLCRKVPISFHCVKKSNIQSLRKTFQFIPTYSKVTLNVSFWLHDHCINATILSFVPLGVWYHFTSINHAQMLAFFCFCQFGTKEVSETEVSCRKIGSTSPNTSVPQEIRSCRLITENTACSQRFLPRRRSEARGNRCHLSPVAFEKRQRHLWRSWLPKTSTTYTTAGLEGTTDPYVTPCCMMYWAPRLAGSIRRTCIQQQLAQNPCLASTPSPRSSCPKILSEDCVFILLPSSNLNLMTADWDLSHKNWDPVLLPVPNTHLCSKQPMVCKIIPLPLQFCWLRHHYNYI